MRIFSLLVLLTVFLTGCTSDRADNDGSTTEWYHQPGYVVAKEHNKILVVRSSSKQALEQKTIKEILDNVRPNAIWVTAKHKSDLKRIAVGDQVRFKIDGGIDHSSPSQAASNKIIKIT
ncbi:DUF3221 domain-containing protein [Paenibacillaceae bacterium]|nr:DUF3221 domain-containing protein [Paenibacillaceae bacterium]